MTVEAYMQSDAAQRRIKAVAKDMRENRGFSYRKSRREALLDVQRFAELIYGDQEEVSPTRHQALMDELLRVSLKETLTEEDKCRLKELKEAI